MGLHERQSRSARAATRASHREVVEEAKSLLAERLDERLTLDELSTALIVSKYHLARVFRAETGFSLHGYRHQLRLRVAVARLGTPVSRWPRSRATSASSRTAT